MTAGFEMMLQRYTDYCDGITGSGSNGDKQKPAEAEPVLSNLLTTAEVANYLNISCRTVWDLSGKGVIKSIKIGGQFRFKREWIDEFIEGQMRNENGDGNN